jgi:MFS family permease
MTALFGFTAASFLCGLAPTLPIPIFFRVIQGATSGALLPLSQAVMLELMLEAFPRAIAARPSGASVSRWRPCSDR